MTLLSQLLSLNVISENDYKNLEFVDFKGSKINIELNKVYLVVNDMYCHDCKIIALESLNKYIGDSNYYIILPFRNSAVQRKDKINENKEYNKNIYNYLFCKPNGYDLKAFLKEVNSPVIFTIREKMLLITKLFDPESKKNIDSLINYHVESLK